MDINNLDPNIQRIPESITDPQTRELLQKMTRQIHDLGVIIRDQDSTITSLTTRIEALE